MRDQGISLLDFNTFGVDCRAREFHEYRSPEELEALIGRGVLEGRHLNVGCGSNLLFVDDFYDGVILRSGIHGIELAGRTPTGLVLRVGAATPWDDVVRWAVARDLYGIENLSGIPGQAGAAAVQNIGAYGMEVCQVIRGVETVSLEAARRTFLSGECGYRYRDSFFKHPQGRRYFVTHVLLELSTHPAFHLDYGGLRARLEAMPGPLSLDKVRQAVLAVRSEKLPDYHVLGNAGSFFKNPVVDAGDLSRLTDLLGSGMPSYRTDGGWKVPAGYLIERAGWKGRRLGRAGVHERQALVLVNLGGATGREIAALSEAIRADILEKYGLRLEPEVNFISSGT